jgi:uncharacterized protein YciI
MRSGGVVTMKYVLFYESGGDTASKAPTYAVAHRAHWKSFQDRGALLMIGPFTNPPGGAMSIFTTHEAAEEFARGDPFVLNGVVGSWQIREWNEVLVSS